MSTAPDPGTPEASIIVPIHRYEEDLAAVLREAIDQLAPRAPRLEIICLVRGDRRALCGHLDEALRTRVRFIEFATSVSEAALLAAGFDAAHGDILLVIPPAFEMAPGTLPALWDALDEGADIACSARLPEGRGRSARLQSRIFNALIRWASGSHFADITSSTRALRRSVATELPLYGEFHRYLPVLADRLGFRVVEVPARQHPAARNLLAYPAADYWRRAIDLLSVFFVSRFTRHPLRLFGGVGALVALAGGIVLLVAAIQRLNGVPLGDRPVLVLGVLLLGLGFQSFTIGLLGELLLFFHGRGVRDYRIARVYPAMDGNVEDTAAASEATARDVN